ncbi:16S rRNA (cytosine(967)-C(5))-methyltransferase [hydrothermal vent metagenome]|uniref:16S rRNA (Cytosine(967)-C(5))-methyltransferase n=1 Tax=hydrothermal vent metagenome TaxID=652676 RepID=A0A3B1CJJ9_9ZZZZ
MIELSENITSYIRSVFGEEFLNKYREFIETDYVPYVRISGSEDEQEEIVKKLIRYEIELKKVNKVPNAYKVLTGTANLGKTLEHALGKYYIQSLSSMIPPLILKPAETDVTLDMCAAPGSKATELAQMMNNKGTLYVNESNGGRTRSLAHNLDKLNIINTGMIVSKGELLSKHFDGFFDKILVDAPCTGLGIVQKKQEVSNWWSINHALKLSETQMKLLVSAIKSLKVGGEIVYSTCTLTLEENEFLINRVLKKHPVKLMDIELPVESHSGYTKYGDVDLSPELAKTRRIIPWEINSEGFFIAKLQKVSETTALVKTELKRSSYRFTEWKNKHVRKIIEELSDWYGIPMEVFAQYNYLLKKNEIQFINADWYAENLILFNRMGIKLGKIDKNGVLVLHTLAAQILQKHITKNIIELTDDAELKTYLTGGTIKTMTDIKPKGRKVIIHNGDMIGSAIATKDGLKSQFPRALRTVDIIF